MSEETYKRSDWQEWQPFIPLDKSEPPPFPMETLPPVLRNISQTVGASDQIDEAVPALMGLGAVATLAQKTARVRATGRWSEQLSLFVVILAESGERKSSAYPTMVGPVHELEAELEAQERESRLYRNEQRRALEAQLATARKGAGSRKGEGGAGPNSSVDEAAQLAAERELMGPEETAPRLAVDDVTTPALKTLMAANGGRIGLLSPEAGFLSVLKGAYSSNGDPADMSALLSAYTGSEPIVVDRTGRSGERIPRPALSVVMVGQPRVFEELCRIPGAQERGLVARFVVARVNSLAGSRFLIVDDEPEPADTPAGRAYAAVLRELADRKVSDAPPVLRLSDEALEHYREWHDALEVERAPEGGAWSVIAEFAGKAHGLALRYAGLFHLCEDSQAQDGDLIDLDTMRRACALADWSLEAHRAAAVGAELLPPVELAQRIIRASSRGTLARSRKSIAGKWAPFTDRDVRNQCGSGRRRPSPQQIEEAAFVLWSMGYVRWVKAEGYFEWNPDLAAGGER